METILNSIPKYGILLIGIIGLVCFLVQILADKEKVNDYYGQHILAVELSLVIAIIYIATLF